MESPLPASASSSDGGQASPSWSSSTNWTVRRGCLQDAICFETSATILEDGGVDEDGAVSVPKGLLLERPAGHEPAPCEIIFYFRQRHEIHRIYVRSTARVYEIYYASEQQDRSSEYLCTVRCGASEKEVFLPSCDSEEATMHPLKYNPSQEASGKMTKSESNTSNDEDGWVEVKVPDSPLLADGSNALSNRKDRPVEANSQIYYEATAEVSDASPCTSITLRLLSLQTKECVHIEEVYIYADPVESTHPGSPLKTTGNMTGSSLFAMLIPSMLQLSKAGSSEIQDKTVSPNIAPQKQGLDVSTITEEMNRKVTSTEVQKTLSYAVEKEQVSASTMLNETNTTFDSRKEVTGSHNVPESVPGKDNATHGHLEKTLDELVLRVGRLEDFLARFEENMLKPLSCIGTRLQRVEQQLDELSSRPTSSKPFQYSRITAPEFHFDDCDSDEGFGISDVVKEDTTVDSPEVKEDATINSPGMVEEDTNVNRQSMERDVLGGSTTLPTDEATSVLASDIYPGLFIKAPEFLNDEDEHVGSNDISESATMPCPKAKEFLSIDDALTSALKAFMLSSSTNVSKNDTAPAPKSQSSSVAVDVPGLEENVMTCEEPEISGTIFPETSQIWGANLDPCEDITFKEGGGQAVCHKKWPQSSYGGFTIEEISSDNHCYVGSEEASRIDDSDNCNRKGSDDDDSDIDEAPSEVRNLMRDCKNWNEESSSDSNIYENMTESHYNMDWLEHSTDSENESYTLHNWLYGRQNDHKFKEKGFMGAMNRNDTNTEASDKSMKRNMHKSKIEIQTALDTFHNGESRKDIQQVLGPLMNDESSLLDVQFVCHDKSNCAFHFDALLRGVVDSEAEGKNWLNDVGEKQQYDSSLLETSQPDAPVPVDSLLIDLEEVTVKSNDFRMDGSCNEPIVSSLI